jgi:probable poly-beta-1,6-N-acetyl-D-glucosamine export protein
MKGRPLLNNIQTLRALAIMLIVAAHVCWKLKELGASPALSRLPACLDDGTVIFVYIAGYLFAHLRSSYSYSSYLIKKFKNVIVPYLLISVPAVYIAVARHGIAPPFPELQGHSLAYQTVWYYLKGGAHLNYALWFIPMISLYYLAAPAFMAFPSNPLLYWLIVPLFCVSVALKRPPFPNLDTIHLAIYFLPSYLFGMWCNQFGDSTLWRLEKFPRLTTILCGAAWVLPLLVSSHPLNFDESGYFTFEHGWVDWLFVQKMLLAVLLTVALKHVPQPVHISLEPLAETSFAIFFLHLFWILLILHYIGPKIPVNIVSWLAVTVIVLSLSYFTARLVNWALPRASGYLIGYTTAKADDKSLSPRNQLVPT